MSATSKPPIPGAGKLLKVDLIVSPFRSEVQRGITELARKPRLVGILASASKPSLQYSEFTRKTCEEIGFEYELRRVGAGLEEGSDSNERTVEDAIIEANEDSNVDGIMVYYPIFGGLQDHYLQQVVSPLKDVEGLHINFHYNLYHNIRFIRPSSLTHPVGTTLHEPHAPGSAGDTPPPGMVKSILPCTPLAIVKCLEHIGVYNAMLDYGDRAYGRTITVINRSEVVGRPLAALLANDGARVFSVDIDSIQEYTKRPTIQPSTDPSVTTATRSYHPHHTVRPSSLNLEQCLALSDAVVSAVPDAKYKVPTAWLKDGCFCVNVAADKNFETNVREKASIYIPAVGKMTILMLLRNLLRLGRYREVLKEETS